MQLQQQPIVLGPQRLVPLFSLLQLLDQRLGLRLQLLPDRLGDVAVEWEGDGSVKLLSQHSSHALQQQYRTFVLAAGPSSHAIAASTKCARAAVVLRARAPVAIPLRGTLSASSSQLNASPRAGTVPAPIGAVVDLLGEARHGFWKIVARHKWTEHAAMNRSRLGC
jgi:hypothetical protein